MPALPGSTRRPRFPLRDMATVAFLSAAVWKLSQKVPSRPLSKLPAAKPALLAVSQLDARLLAASALALASLLCLALRVRADRRRVLLLDFAAWKGRKELASRQDWMMDRFREVGVSEDNIEFMKRCANRSGVSEHALLPHLMIVPYDHPERPFNRYVDRLTIDEARVEAEMVIFETVAEVLEKTSLRPRDIDFLVVNCSLFVPTPSLSAMVANHFKMRADCVNYNLGGMGCSAGMIAVDLAARLLRDRPGSYALVISTENVTQNAYFGNNKSMLIPNALFKAGCAASIMTNVRAERARAKYELDRVVRVSHAADPDAYRCVYQREDDEGHVGVELSRDIVKVAARSLQANLTKLGPRFLPFSEQIKFAVDFLARRHFGRKGGAPYVPKFGGAFDHFCLHAGGRGVVDGLSKQLGLDARQASPSWHSLFWYGNTSSASVWYALGFIEACQRVRRGDLVWQVGFGSGFKCNSAVWRALRTMEGVPHGAWDHMDGLGNREAVDVMLRNGGVSQGPDAPRCYGRGPSEIPYPPVPDVVATVSTRSGAAASAAAASSSFAPTPASPPKKAGRGSSAGGSRGKDANGHGAAPAADASGGDAGGPTSKPYFVAGPNEVLPPGRSRSTPPRPRRSPRNA